MFIPPLLRTSKASTSVLTYHNLSRSRIVSSMSTSSSSSNDSNLNQTTKVKKPNLREAGKNNAPRNIVVAACILVAIYMYPMIFKPMFGIESSSPEQAKKLEEIKYELDKHRPSFMPEWSSPFGPKSKD